MEYRFGMDHIYTVLEAWDNLLPRRSKLHLIARGGTALTLLGYKASTKDVDFLVPILGEFQKLCVFLQKAGYQRVTTYGWQRPGELTIFDLYPGSKVYTTELVSSPMLQGGHRKIREWKRIYLGVLNEIDLIITKLFRGTEVDFEDCREILRQGEVDLNALKARLCETAKRDISEDKALRNYSQLLQRCKIP